MNLTSTQLQKIQEFSALDYVDHIDFVTIGDLAAFDDHGYIHFTVPDIENTVLKSEGTIVKYVNGSDYEWAGKLTDREGFLMLVARPEGKAGYIKLEDNFYTLLPIDNERNIVLKYKPSAYGEPDCLSTNPTSSMPVDYCEEDNNTCPAEIKTLVIITPEAREVFLGMGNPFIAVLVAELGVQATNFGFQSSQVVNKQLAREFMFIDWFELSDNIIDDIFELAGNDEIVDLREQTHADLVVMLTDNRYAGFSGAALGGNAPCFDCAFAIVEVESMIMPRWTFAHEVAHLFGADHNRSSNVGNCEELFGNADCGADDDNCAHGWRFTDSGGTDRRTIMSLLHSTEQAAGIERILHYSNPDVDYEGVATGDDQSGTGDDSDNSRIIRNSGCLISNYFPPNNLSVMIHGPTLLCPGDPTPHNSTINEPALGYIGQPPYTYEWRWSLFPTATGFPFSNPGLADDPTFKVSNFPFLYDFAEFWLILKVTSQTDGASATANFKVKILDGCFSNPPEGLVGGIVHEVALAPKKTSSFSQPTFYPNPTHGIFTIVDPSPIFSIEITTLQGRTVLFEEMNEGQKEIVEDISSLPAGFYFVKTKHVDGMKTHRIALAK